MTRVDLITGFLGAGKTTFIQRILRHQDGQKTLIIENEFGSIGVDAQFMRDEGCPIEDLSGVCMCCKGRDRFIAMLIDAAAHGYDRVLVEPSGIYDVDEFFSVMDTPAVSSVCQIGSILTIVDAHIPEDMPMETGYLMVTQLLAAGAVVLSKTQTETADPKKTVSWLNALIRDYGGTRVLGREVCTKCWDDLTDEDITQLMSCGCHRESHIHKDLTHDGIYDSFFSAAYCRDESDLTDRLTAVFEDNAYGRILRVKGFLRSEEGTWYKVNCTRQTCSVVAAPNVRRGVLVIIGQELNNEALMRMFPNRRKR